MLTFQNALHLLLMIKQRAIDNTMHRVPAGRLNKVANKYLKKNAIYMFLSICRGPPMCVEGKRATNNARALKQVCASAAVQWSHSASCP